MALITMAVYDTESNERTDCTRRTLASLLETVEFSNHRMHIVNNASHEESRDLIQRFAENVGNDRVIVTHLDENVGCAKGVNIGLSTRHENEHCIKMDNDVVIHQAGWADQLEEAVNRDPGIGILGLKRKDLMEHPTHEDSQFKSELVMLPKEPWQTWIVVERVKHVVGTCQLFNHRLLDRIGYLNSPGPYGYDDSLVCVRCEVAGFSCCFMPHIEIDHLDEGSEQYSRWKWHYVVTCDGEFNRLVDGYRDGSIDIYYGVDG